MNKQGKKGFTLTELMTVVVILSIFMGIAAGSYRKAAERSHFAEGLTAAHAVMGAVERYHDNYPDTTQPTFEKLDITLAHQKNCQTATDYCKKIKYFEVTVNNGSVQAKRLGNKYTITVYPETFGANRFAEDTCSQSGGKTDFCVSVGYTACTSGTCKQP